MRFGLIGKHLGHSYSKIIHEQLIDETYDLCSVNEKELDELLRSRSFKGINVTIPYKETVIPYLDFIDDKARRIGAVNTIVNKNNKLYGYNTDYDGFYQMVNNHIVCNHNVNDNSYIKNKVCVILGNGGASKAVKCVLEDMNAKIIYKVSIQKEKYDDETIKKENIINYEELDKLQVIDVIVNTTPVGMYPNMAGIIIDLQKFKNLSVVFDVVYNPIRTFFAQKAEQLGIPYYTGLEMLVVQAIYAHQYFHNKIVNNDVVSNIIRNIKQQVLNIVLIGMPGSGKSTIASELGTKLNMEVIDCDILIEEKTNKKIADIFKEDGEQTFRKIENSVVNDVSLVHQKIISTGGGVILDENNMKLLKANGIIIFIDRQINKIVYDNVIRPLSLNKEELIKRYNERIDKYHNYADLIVQNNNDILDVVEEIILYWQKLQ